jgi:ankyrin repeat protein
VVEYQQQAERLLARLAARDGEAQWRVYWEHRHFRGKTIDDVRSAALTMDDAREVVARTHHFEDWLALVAFANAVATDPGIQRFEAAVESLIAGDTATLGAMLREYPELVHARSARRHKATLLHYIAANGVENARQQTPPNSVAIATLLLDAGAVPDALADMYDHKCTTMSMLVSSTPPHRAGLQLALAETLLAYGAALEGPGTNWQSAVQTALAFGFLDTAQALAQRGAAIGDVATAAGLGRADVVVRLLPSADAPARHRALALASQHGHTEVVRMLLDAGEDPNRYNPEGLHAHSLPLHQAVWSDRMEVVRLLVERGARLDVRDKVYNGTPLDWAEYGQKAEIAAYLRKCS